MSIGSKEVIAIGAAFAAGSMSERMVRERLGDDLGARIISTVVGMGAGALTEQLVESLIERTFLSDITNEVDEVAGELFSGVTSVVSDVFSIFD